jgi:hypothetical protein
MAEKGQCLDVLWKSRLARKDDYEAEITLLYPGVGSLLVNFCDSAFFSHLSQFPRELLRKLEKRIN